MIGVELNAVTPSAAVDQLSRCHNLGREVIRMAKLEVMGVPSPNMTEIRKRVHFNNEGMAI